MISVLLFLIMFGMEELDMRMSTSHLTTSTSGSHAHDMTAPVITHHERTHQDEAGSFVIRYAVNRSGQVMIPAVANAKAHYSAKIEVFRIVEGQEHFVGAFNGTYVDGGCFEDEPAAMVREALNVERGK